MYDMNVWYECMYEQRDYMSEKQYVCLYVWMYDMKVCNVTTCVYVRKTTCMHECMYVCVPNT